MRVGCIGQGVARDVLEAQLAASSYDCERIAPDEIDAEDVIVVCGDRGDPIFHTTQERAFSKAIPMVAIERGGLAGVRVPGVDASVVSVHPDGPCLHCLQSRVESTGAHEAEKRAQTQTSEGIAGAYAGALVHTLHTEGWDRERSKVITVPYHERTLLSVPGCETCDPEWANRWDDHHPESAERSLDAAIDAAEQTLDPFIGLITEIGEAASYPMPYYLSTVADTSSFSDGSAPSHAAGVAEDWNRAFMKGMGEALERYAAAIYRTEHLRAEHPDALEDSLDLEVIVRPDDWPAIDSPIPWIPGNDLGSGTRRWIPADLVVFPPDRRLVRPGITTGLALGNSPAETALSGVLEVLERDATMLSWYSTFEPIGLSVDDPIVDRLTRFAGLVDLDVSLTLVTQDVDVPIVAACVHREDSFPRFAAGSAAGIDPVETARDALREAVQNWMEMAEMGPELAANEAERLAAYATDPAGLDAYLSPGVTIDASELGGTRPDSTEDALDQLVTKVEDAGMTPTIAWITPNDLRSLGFVAARVVIPDAQPLLLSTTYFGDRAATVPNQMGFEARLDRRQHPFP